MECNGKAMRQDLIWILPDFMKIWQISWEIWRISCKIRNERPLLASPMFVLSLICNCNSSECQKKWEPSAQVVQYSMVYWELIWMYYFTGRVNHQAKWDDKCKMYKYRHYWRERLFNVYMYTSVIRFRQTLILDPNHTFIIKHMGK